MTMEEARQQYDRDLNERKKEEGGGGKKELIMISRAKFYRNLFQRRLRKRI